MMTVKVAKTAGFCFGVKRAVETVYKEAEKQDKPIYTYGPIIHNEEVVADLEKKWSEANRRIEFVQRRLQADSIKHEVAAQEAEKGK